VISRFKKWARQSFPINFPVRYYIRHPSKLPGMHGYFLLDEDGERGIIVVSSGCSGEIFLDTLCEELAHARTAYLCTEDEDPHTPSFWAEYGRIVSACREQHW
jgi:hypothetical protein